MVSIPRRDYAALYGPTVGDGVRLADTTVRLLDLQPGDLVWTLPLDW